MSSTARFSTSDASPGIPTTILSIESMDIETPDTVAVPILVSRLQAAGGLVTVGNTVDVYLRTNASTQSSGNETNTSTSTSPEISGATVLAILRSSSTGTIDANLTQAQSAANAAAAFSTTNASGSGSGSGSSYSKSVQVTNVQELLKAAASRT